MSLVVILNEVNGCRKHFGDILLIYKWWEVIGWQNYFVKINIKKYTSKSVKTTKML